MKDLEYTYAVARIRALENALLPQSFIEQLIVSSNVQQAMSMLSEKGWTSDSSDDVDAMLARQEVQAWNTVMELAPDRSVFDVMLLPKLYHNLKAAIKEVCTETSNEHIFYDDCSIPGREMLAIVSARDFDRLPGSMSRTAREAYDTLLHTRDGQLCDIIVDRALLGEILACAARTKNPMIEAYAQQMVAIADIKIAVRGCKTGKSADFMRRAMEPCRELSTEQLIHAAVGGMDMIREYLLTTSYSGAAEALSGSASVFERWCDNRLLDGLRGQKYESFSVGPLLAYLIARDNEIKTVRMILTGKQNSFPEDVIRERVRKMYV